MFTQAIENILKDQCTPAVVRAIEAGGSTAALWQALQGAGFLELLASEDAGGAGLPLADLFPILCSFGRYTVPVPVAQTIVARALLGSQFAMPNGMITLGAALRREADGAIVCSFTPYGRVADFVLAQDGDALLLLPCAAAQREASGVHGSLAANLRWPGVASFCYILDFGEPAGAREIGGFATPVPVAVRDPPHRGVRAGMHTLRRGLAVVQTGASSRTPTAGDRGSPSVCAHLASAAVR